MSLLREQKVQWNAEKDLAVGKEKETEREEVGAETETGMVSVTEAAVAAGNEKEGRGRGLLGIRTRLKDMQSKI